jgi:hypothetical protein
MTEADRPAELRGDTVSLPGVGSVRVGSRLSSASGATSSKPEKAKIGVLESVLRSGYGIELPWGRRTSSSSPAAGPTSPTWSAKSDDFAPSWPSGVPDLARVNRHQGGGDQGDRAVVVVGQVAQSQ